MWMTKWVLLINTEKLLYNNSLWTTFHITCLTLAPKIDISQQNCSYLLSKCALPQLHVRKVGKNELFILALNGSSLGTINFWNRPNTLSQACTTYSPRATCGPRDLFFRPARTQLQKILQKPDFG